MRMVQEHLQEDEFSEEAENENERRKRALEMKKRLFGSFYCEAGLGLYDGFRDARSRKLKRAPKRPMIDHSYDYMEDNNSAIELAKEVQAHVARNSPSFIKSMVYTNVTRGFSLKLPKQFCHLHLPRHDTTVTLVDEGGEEYKTNFLVERSALSGGWRGFSRENKLLLGDVLVFHMVKPSKFKVYIVRSHGLAEVDGALGLMNLNACPKQIDLALLVGVSGSDKHLSSNTLKWISSSGFTADFEDGKSIKHFTVIVNGLNTDSASDN